MVFDSTETYLYSADLRANKIWTHKKDPETGKLDFVHCVEAPDPGDHPRWAALHPSGAYLYVLMEAGNRLAVYVIDEKTHTPTFTHMTYPLIPPGSYLTESQSLDLIRLTSSRHPQRKNNVQKRRSLPLPQQQIPLRNLSCQLTLTHRLHRRFRTWSKRQHRETDMSESYADKWRTFKRR